MTAPMAVETAAQSVIAFVVRVSFLLAMRALVLVTIAFLVDLRLVIFDIIDSVVLRIRGLLGAEPTVAVLISISRRCSHAS